MKHRINTGNSKPARHNLRRTPFKFEEEEKKHRQQMLEKGVHQPLISDCVTCPVLVRKKDGSIRYCLDYRGLNHITTKDVFPLPRIESCLDTLKGTTCMSNVNMAAGYSQIEINPGVAINRLS